MPHCLLITTQPRPFQQNKGNNPSLFVTAALIDSLLRGVIESHLVHGMEVNGSLVAPLVFKTSVGLNKVPGGFDSHSPPCGCGPEGRRKKQKKKNL